MTATPGPGWHLGQQLVEHVFSELAQCETTRAAVAALDDEERAALQASTLEVATTLVRGAVTRETERHATTTNLCVAALLKVVEVLPTCMHGDPECVHPAMHEVRTGGWPSRYACDDPAHRKGTGWTELSYAPALRAVSARLK